MISIGQENRSLNSNHIFVLLQIILCEALVCALELPVQAHEGALTCFHAGTQSIQTGFPVKQ